MEKMVGKSLQRIFDDITASHAKTASRNYFENELHIQFSETLKILKKKKWKIAIIITQNLKTSLKLKHA